ncbi:MAG TPA: MFS transporter [Kofleriaceae bacterium]|jgi:PAT family beta-lactamase induction signal transducer AmpG|nr:MFS transporter [Kofleriaceae bacterium]
MGWLAVFRSRRMAVLFVLGFSSGLPLMLTGQTLQAWLTAEGLPLGRIAAVSSVGLAYTFKAAWAPLLDRFQLPVLGRRRGWVLAFQLGLVAAIAAMSRLDPARDLAAVLAVAVAIAVLSASQDVVLDAYMTDVLAPHERAAGSSVNVIGYRIAMVVSSSLALAMADHVAWPAIWLTMAACMALATAGTVLAEEPAAAARPPRTIAQSITLPVADIWRRYRGGAIAVLGFAAIYRFGDYFAQALVMPFLQRGAGFNFTEIAVVHKLIGLAGAVVGGVLGGALVARFGMRRMLLGFGALSAVTHLLYVWLAIAGKSIPVFCVAVACDATANAMVAAVFVGFLMSVCSPAVSATQFALLTSLTSVGQRVFGPLADRVVDAIGWPGYFAVCAAMVLPGLALVGPATRIAERGQVARGDEARRL